MVGESSSVDLAIVVPLRHDWDRLAPLLSTLAPWCAANTSADPAADDAKYQVQLWLCAADEPSTPPPAWVHWVRAEQPGRGQQIAQAIDAVSARYYWILHADSVLSATVLDQLAAVVLAPAEQWGRFDVELESSRPLVKLVERMMNARSRLTGIATGDQGMFVHRSLLTRVGGVPRQALMEDIELSSRLRRLQAPLCLPGPLQTSARRWHRHGAVRTIVAMWRFRFRYWLGADAEVLAREYYGVGAAPSLRSPESS